MNIHTSLCNNTCRYIFVIRLTSITLLTYLLFRRNCVQSYFFSNFYAVYNITYTALVTLPRDIIYEYDNIISFDLFYIAIKMLYTFCCIFIFFIHNKTNLYYIYLREHAFVMNAYWYRCNHRVAPECTRRYFTHKTIGMDK